MKNLYVTVFVIFMILSHQGYSQCTAAAGSTNATSCKCSDTTNTNCDLLPDIAIARLPLTQASNYTEYAQICNPPCSGNDGRLRLGVSTPIIGFGPLETRGTAFYVCGTDTFNAGTVANIPTACPDGSSPHQLINQRIYHKTGNVMSYIDRAAGSMTYHPSHGHQHVDNWGIYSLRQSNGDPNPLNWPIIGTGTKLGFCLLDIGSCNGSPGYCTDSAGNTLTQSNFNTNKFRNYGLGGGNYSCSNTVQGISNGYMDTYSQGLDGMWINIPPGVCNGTYYIVVQIDPLNYFTETNENNNVVAVPFTLTKQGGTVPVISANGPTTFCAGGSVILSSTTAANYVWSTGATTQSIVVNTAGTYTVTVNTSLSCSSSSLPVTVTVSTLTVTPSASPASICAGQSTQLSVTHNASGTANVPTLFTNNTQVFIPDNNATGVTSSVTVSGISPATLSSGTVVSVKLNLTHTYDGDLIVSLIAPSGNTILLSNRRGGSGDNFTNTIFSMSATTSIASGSAPFTGSYIPDASFNSLTGSVNGLWRLKVADVASTDTGRIQNWTLTVNNVVAVPPTFSWTSTSGFTSTTQNPNVTPTSTTTYTVVVTAANGCTGSNIVTVFVNPLPTVTAGNVSGCTGTAIALSGTPGGGTWSVANPYIGPSTTYTHTYTDVNGCTNTSAAANITVNPLPIVTANNVSGCTGSAIALSGTPSGGTWSIANPYTGPSTTYTHTYTDVNGCTNTSAAANITVNPLPIVTANNVSGCTGSAITLSGTPSGGTWSVANPYTGPSTTYTHTYTDANGCTNISAAANITVNPLPAVIANNVSGCTGSAIALSGTPSGGTWSVANPYTGPSTTYTHTYTDANGCTNISAPANITVNPLPTVIANNVSGCTGAAIALSATPAGGTFSVANPYTGPSTTYTYTYTDGNGCSNTSAAANITVNPLPTVTANNVSGCTGTAIALSATPAGGTFSVANPYTGPSTTYTYTYTDGNGCSNTSAAANITVNPLPTVIANNISGCTGTAIALSATPAGGTFSVANPYTGASTTYTYTYTDGNGCSNTSATANITVNPLPTVSFSGLASSYSVSASAVTLTGSPAGGIFSGPGISGNTFTPSAAGVGGPYTIAYSYTNGNGCSNSSSQQTTVTNCTTLPQPGTISAIGGFTKVCPGETRSYYVGVVSGVTSYTWTPPTGGTITSGQGTTYITVNYTASFTASGTLSVVANNLCGSGAPRTQAITRNTPEVPGIISGLGFGVCSGTGIPYSVVNVAGITYNWSFNVGSASVATGQGTNSITANYTSAFVTGYLSVTASNVCGTSAARNLTVNATPNTPTSITGATTVCANQFGVPYSIAAIPSATSYTWTGMTGSHISDGVVTSAGAVLTTTSTAVTVNFGNTTGKLNVRANNACGSGLNYFKVIGFNCKTAGEENNTTSLELYPNPAKEFIDVAYITSIKGNGSITISDILGREIYKQYINWTAGENSSRINLKGTIKGIYLLTIDQAGQKITKKLVVD